MYEQGVRESVDERTTPEHSDLQEAIRRLKIELGRKEEEQRAISQIHRAVSAHLDNDGLVEAVAASARPVVPFSCMAVVLPGVNDHDILVSVVELKQDQATCHRARVMPSYGTVAAWVLEHKEPFVAHQIDDLRPFPFCYEECRKAGIQSLCAFPFLIRNQAVGALIFEGPGCNLYPDVLLPFLREFTAAVAVAVDNRLAYEGRARLKTQLAFSNFSGVEPAVGERALENIVGQSQAIKEVIRRICLVAGTDSSVLISGETGTGKELVARAIFQLSGRRQAPFITVNCAALPVGIIESELFGHEKGAFTGAIVRRAGRFELANGGTIFLDEIGDLPQEVQAKLLRVLQDREFERVGGTRTMKVNVRVIAATNQSLPKAVANKTFRSDLFYRLNVFPVHLPPLRERREDIPPIAEYLLGKYAGRFKKAITTIDADTIQRLVAYSWPGNVRELENVIERGVIVSKGSLFELEEDVPAPTRIGLPRRPSLNTTAVGRSEDGEPREEIDRLLNALTLAGGNHSRAARFLRIGRTTLWRKLKLHGLGCLLASVVGEKVLLPIWPALCVF